MRRMRSDRRLGRDTSVRSSDLASRVLLRRFEGGAVYLADAHDKFYVITDESALSDLLGEDSPGELVSVREFDTPEDRLAYINARGWTEPEPER